MDKITMQDGDHKVTIECPEVISIEDVIDTFLVPGLLGMTFSSETIIKALGEYAQTEGFKPEVFDY